MQTFETSLHYRLLRVGDSARLTRPRLLVDHMRGAFASCTRRQSSWLISMNPKCRRISRTLLRTRPPCWQRSTLSSVQQLAFAQSTCQKLFESRFLPTYHGSCHPKSPTRGHLRYNGAGQLGAA